MPSQKRAQKGDLDQNTLLNDCVEAGVPFWIAVEAVLEAKRSKRHGKEALLEALRKKDAHAAEQFERYHTMQVRTSRNTIEPFERSYIARSLVAEAGLADDDAARIAAEVEAELRKLKLRYLSAPLIREFACVKMLEHGLEATRKAYTRVGMPVYDVTELIENGSNENANLMYNPETVHKLMADKIAKEYALVKAIPSELADAHMRGELHIHDLEYFVTRPFCFSHDLRFFLKRGLRIDGSGKHTAIAAPAKRAEVALLHAAKVLAASQVNCAGGQGFNWFNTLLAPFVEGMNYKKVRQLAQMFVFEMSQTYVSRGGQTVFSSIDVDMGVPAVLRDVKAVLPGGVTNGATYGDYEDEARTWFRALCDVYSQGDSQGKPFSFPKFEIKISPGEMGRNAEEHQMLSELAAKFGTPYYIVQQPYMPEYSCYQCCAFIMDLPEMTDANDLQDGSVRGGALQVVTLNLPRIAYESAGSDARLFELLGQRMDAAKRVLQLKQQIIKRNLKNGLLPFLGQPVGDTPYLDVDRQSLVIGFVGLNEMLRYHTGSELHESDSAWRFGLKTIKEMKERVAEFRKETQSNFALARTPAESCSHRFALIDTKRFPDAIVQGDAKSGAVYYTNSFHVRPSADVPLFERLQREGSFHALCDGGCMSHVWLGEAHPDTQALGRLTQSIAKNTAMQYFAYTQDLTVCGKCDSTFAGVHDACRKCGSADVEWYSRITGYYQRVKQWNAGKRQEFMDRRRYALHGA
jgi:ribonucleoside-triphosphate reductase